MRPFINYQFGTSLVELLVTALFSSLLALGAVEWYLSLTQNFKVQAKAVEGNEVGQFVISYLSKAVRRAGAGLPPSIMPIEFDNDVLIVRYGSSLASIGEIKNCLDNSAKTSVIADRFSIEEYSKGGYELKCSSSGNIDWLTEGVNKIEYQVAIDNGRFEGNNFIAGEYDGIPETYVPSDQFDPVSMKAVALRVHVTVYRPMDGIASKTHYWNTSKEEREVIRQFTSLLLLPNIHL